MKQPNLGASKWGQLFRDHRAALNRVHDHWNPWRLEYLRLYNAYMNRRRDMVLGDREFWLLPPSAEELGSGEVHILKAIVRPKICPVRFRQMEWWE